MKAIIEFKKYQHIERLDTDDTEGILIGIVYVFPKIDGTNSVLWWDKKLNAGSRNRHLSLDDDNQGFYEWALKQDMFVEFFKQHPNIRLYGEWLVPHTLRTYEETAWNRFYVFDVYDEYYIHYDIYRNYLDEFGIDYIPPLCRIKNPTKEKLIAQLDKNFYLIKDGHGVGEGIVIKNYEFRNKFGRQNWAKIVKNDFKAKFDKFNITDVKDKLSPEDRILNKYVTVAFIEKEFAKIKNEQGWNSKKIPQLFGRIYHELIKEESWNFIKELRNPIIDYKRLNQLVIQKIKMIKPELF